MKRKVKIKFCDFEGLMDIHDNVFINTLKKKYEVELSEKPDYIIYNHNSKDFLKYDGIRIFWTNENLVPDFNLCDYAISFSYLEFQDRYMRCPNFLMRREGHSYYDNCKKMCEKHLNTEKKVEEKTEFCSFVVSNAIGASCRGKFFDTLNERKRVNSGGKYRNNIGEYVLSKLEFQSKHKFSIAFENSSTSGYTTEKIMEAYAANTIPIYWGDPDIDKVFNKDSFINCNDFGLTEKGEDEAIDRIIEYVLKVDNDMELYKKMLKTPALKDENYVLNKEKEFEDFLFHIFEQDLEKAYRRNRLFWGERYERKQKIGTSFYFFCRKMIPLRDMFRKFIK